MYAIRSYYDATTELGFQTVLFKNRLSFDVSYYNKRIYNQLVSAARTPASGISSIYLNSDEERARRGCVITSYSIHYTKLYESNQVKQHVVDELKMQMETEMRYNPDIYVDSELQQHLKIAFEKLPPRTAEIFTLSRFKGYTNDEIADDLGRRARYDRRLPAGKTCHRITSYNVCSTKLLR